MVGAPFGGPARFTRDILALGDFNLPKAEPGDPVFDELTDRGLHLPDFQTKIGTTLDGDRHYDQVGLRPRAHPGRPDRPGGVFDFDEVLFGELWESRGETDYDAYTPWAISDHRPLWVELAV